MQLKTTGPTVAIEGDSVEVSFYVIDSANSPYSLAPVSVSGCTVESVSFNSQSGRGSVLCSMANGPVTAVVNISVTNAISSTSSESHEIEVADAPPTVGMYSPLYVGGVGDRFTVNYTIRDDGDDSYTLQSVSHSNCTEFSRNTLARSGSVVFDVTSDTGTIEITLTLSSTTSQTVSVSRTIRISPDYPQGPTAPKSSITYTVRPFGSPTNVNVVKATLVHESLSILGDIFPLSNLRLVNTLDTNHAVFAIPRNTPTASAMYIGTSSQPWTVKKRESISELPDIDIIELAPARFAIADLTAHDYPSGFSHVSETPDTFTTRFHSTYPQKHPRHRLKIGDLLGVTSGTNYDSSPISMQSERKKWWKWQSETITELPQYKHTAEAGLTSIGMPPFTKTLYRLGEGESTVTQHSPFPGEFHKVVGGFASTIDSFGKQMPLNISPPRMEINGGSGIQSKTVTIDPMPSGKTIFLYTNIINHSTTDYTISYNGTPVRTYNAGGDTGIESFDLTSIAGSGGTITVEPEDENAPLYFVAGIDDRIDGFGSLQFTPQRYTPSAKTFSSGSTMSSSTGPVYDFSGTYDRTGTGYVRSDTVNLKRRPEFVSYNCRELPSQKFPFSRNSELTRTGISPPSAVDTEPVSSQPQQLLSLSSVIPQLATHPFIYPVDKPNLSDDSGFNPRVGLMTRDPITGWNVPIPWIDTSCGNYSPFQNFPNKWNVRPRTGFGIQLGNLPMPAITSSTWSYTPSTPNGSPSPPYESGWFTYPYPFTEVTFGDISRDIITFPRYGYVLSMPNLTDLLSGVTLSFPTGTRHRAFRFGTMTARVVQYNTSDSHTCLSARFPTTFENPLVSLDPKNLVTNNDSTSTKSSYHSFNQGCMATFSPECRCCEVEVELWIHPKALYVGRTLFEPSESTLNDYRYDPFLYVYVPKSGHLFHIPASFLVNLHSYTSNLSGGFHFLTSATLSLSSMCSYVIDGISTLCVSSPTPLTTEQRTPTRAIVSSVSSPSYLTGPSGQFYYGNWLIEDGGGVWHADDSCDASGGGVLDPDGEILNPI